VGSGGEEILIKDKNELIKEKINFDRDYILQEFIDTSKGIKGLVSGVHDLRVVLLNEKIPEVISKRITHLLNEVNINSVFKSNLKKMKLHLMNL